MCDASNDIWDSIRRECQGSKNVKHTQLQALHCEFKALAMKEWEFVNHYIARTLTIASKMSAHGESKEETVIDEKIIISMTSRLNYVVCSIEESTTLSIDELQSSCARIKNEWILIRETMMNKPWRCHIQEGVLAMKEDVIFVVGPNP